MGWTDLVTLHPWSCCSLMEHPGAVYQVFQVLAELGTLSQDWKLVDVIVTRTPMTHASSSVKDNGEHLIL